MADDGQTDITESRIDPRWRDQLTDEQRAMCAADPELCERFNASAASHLAMGGRYTFAWSCDSTGYIFNPRAVFDSAAHEVRTEREHAEIAKIDALIVVELQVDGVRAVTSLDALCVDQGLDWGERVAIRATLAAGQAYEQDRQGGWSKLPKRAVVRAAALLARAA